MSGRGKGGKVSSGVSNKCLLQADPRFRVSERAAPSVTARSSATTSRASPSLPSVVSLVEVVSSVSPVSSTKRPEVFSRSSWRMFVSSSLFLRPLAYLAPSRLSVIQLLILSTPSERPSLLLMSFMPSSGQVAPSTDSVLRISPLLRAFACICIINVSLFYSCQCYPCVSAYLAHACDF